TDLYNSMLRCSFLSQESHAARFLFSIMRDLGVYQNNTTYRIMIEGLSPLDEKASLEIIQTMRESGLEMNAATYGALLKRYFRKEDFKGAEDLFLEMKEKGVRPNTYTYSIMMQGYLPNNTKRALQLFYEMKEDHIPRNSYTYGVLLRGLSKSGESTMMANV